MSATRDEMHHRDEERKAAGVPYVGYPSDEPCDVCGAIDMNQTEPRFGYTVCRKDASLSAIEVGAQKAARNPILRMERVGAETGRTDATKANRSQPPARRVMSLEESMALWGEHSPAFPYHRQTSGDVVRPTGAAAKMLGDFLAVPVPFLGLIFWGFKREVDAEFFDRNYPVIKEEVRGQ